MLLANQPHGTRKSMATLLFKALSVFAKGRVLALGLLENDSWHLVKKYCSSPLSILSKLELFTHVSSNDHC
jgi:hypothetical protein